MGARHLSVVAGHVEPRPKRLGNRRINLLNGSRNKLLSKDQLQANVLVTGVPTVPSAFWGLKDSVTSAALNEMVSMGNSFVPESETLVICAFVSRMSYIKILVALPVGDRT